MDVLSDRGDDNSGDRWTDPDCLVLDDDWPGDPEQGHEFNRPPGAERLRPADDDPDRMLWFG